MHNNVICAVTATPDLLQGQHLPTSGHDSCAQQQRPRPSCLPGEHCTTPCPALPHHAPTGAARAAAATRAIARPQQGLSLQQAFTPRHHRTAHASGGEERNSAQWDVVDSPPFPLFF